MSVDIFPEEKQKKASFFWPGLFIYIGIALILCVITFRWFYGFIGAYEKSQTKYGMDYVMELFATGDVTSLFSEDTGSFATQADAAAFIKKYNEYISGKEMSFEKAVDYTDMTPVFSVKADGKKVADVTLTHQKMAKYNFQEWFFESMDVKEYASLFYEPVSITITAPENAVISINNTALDISNLNDNQELKWPKEVELFAPEIKSYKKYQINDLVTIPEIAVSLDGKDLYVTNQAISLWKKELGEDNSESTDFMAYVVNPDEAFLKEMVDYTMNVLENYAYKFVGLNTQINKYVMPDSELMDTIRTAVTNFYPTKRIESYGFDSLTVDNFIQYTDNVFSCEAQYNLHLDFEAGYYVADTHEVGHFRMFFVKQNDNWYLTAIDYLD